MDTENGREIKSKAMRRRETIKMDRNQQMEREGKERKLEKVQRSRGDRERTQKTGINVRKEKRKKIHFIFCLSSFPNCIPRPKLNYKHGYTVPL